MRNPSTDRSHQHSRRLICQRRRSTLCVGPYFGNIEPGLISVNR
jgi:hypothetical protein